MSDEEKEISEETTEEEAESGTDMDTAVFEEDEKKELNDDSSDESEEYDTYMDMLLSNMDVCEIASREKTDIIYVLGDTSSGKTTFETMIYGSLLKEVDEEWLFAGSQTLIAYERRKQYVFLQNTNMDVDYDMPRTSSGSGRHFLHLRLYNQKTEEKRNLLFTDYSGEIYESCRVNKNELEKEMSYIQIAKHILLFLDGTELIKKEKRQKVVFNARNFLNMLKNSSKYNADCIVDIVISKNDELIGQSDDVKDYIYQIRKHFEKFEKFNDFRYYFIEAEQLNDPIDKENSIGMMGLLKKLLDNDRKDRVISKKCEEKPLVSDEFNMLKNR